MFRNLAGALLLLSSITVTHAQTGGTKPATQSVDNFYVNPNRKIVGFRLPATTQLNDVIYMTRENGVVVKKADVTKEVLASGQNEFSLDNVPPGTYVVLVAANSRIKYKFTFINTTPVAAAVIPVVTTRKKTPETPVVNAFATTVLSFNPQTKEFAVASDIPFREGSKIEVFDAWGGLLASREVTMDMLKAKRFPIIAEQLKPGTYYVSVDDVRFGSVTYSE